MKISKLLNKKKLFFFLTFFLFISSTLYSEEEPVDIWDIDSKINNTESKIIELNEDINDEESVLENSIYKMNSEKQENLEIKEDEKLLSEKIQVTGLYDPEENELSIDMWSNTNGEQIINIFKGIRKVQNVIIR